MSDIVFTDHGSDMPDMPVEEDDIDLLMEMEEEDKPKKKEKKVRKRKRTLPPPSLPAQTIKQPNNQH